MKELTEYINENTMSLNEYMINEGFLSFLKKIWNWMFNDAKENVEKNNGVYKSSETLIDSVTNNEKIKGEFEFAQQDNESFDKFIKVAKSEEEKSTFYKAKEIKDKNKNLTIFACNLTISKTEKGTIAFLFCESNKKDKKLEIKHIVFANDIVNAAKDIKNNNLAKQIVSEFDNYCKNKIKFIITTPVDKDVVNDIKYDIPEKTNKESKNNKEETDKKEYKTTKEQNKENKSAEEIIKLGEKRLYTLRSTLYRLGKGCHFYKNNEWPENTLMDIDYNNLNFEIKSYDVKDDNKDEIIKQLKDIKPRCSWDVFIDDCIKDFKRRNENQKNVSQYFCSVKYNDKLLCIVSLDESWPNSYIYSAKFNYKLETDDNEKLFNKSFAAAIANALYEFINENRETTLEN